jgi:hypothetical protein
MHDEPLGARCWLTQGQVDLLRLDVQPLCVHTDPDDYLCAHTAAIGSSYCAFHWATTTGLSVR